MVTQAIGQTGSSFRQEVERGFDFLLDPMGFQITEEYDDPNLIGNAIVVLRKESVQLRFVKDRADFYCDLGMTSTPQRWYALYDVLTWLIRGGMAFEPYKPVNRLPAVSRLFRRHAEAILTAFCENYDTINGALRPT